MTTNITTSRSEIIDKFKNSINKDIPIRKFSIPNLVFQYYVDKLVSQPKNHPFDFDKLYKLESYFNLRETYPKFSKYFSSVMPSDPQKKKKVSFLNNFYFFILPTYLKGSTIFTFMYIIQILFPIAMRAYINWLKDDQAPEWHGITYCICILILAVCRPILFHSGFYYNIKSMAAC